MSRSASRGQDLADEFVQSLQTKRWTCGSSGKERRSSAIVSPSPPLPPTAIGSRTFIPAHPSKLPLSPISTRRLLAGVGQERGSIGVEITNNLDRVAEVIWIETWPWWVRGFISTLEGKLSSNGSSSRAPFLLLLSPRAC